MSSTIGRRVGACLALAGAVAGSVTIVASGGVALAVPGQIDVTLPAGSGGIDDVTVLPNGNVVVVDAFYDDGAVTDVGAVYLYDGATQTLISTLTGSSTDDRVGVDGVVVLSDGNFVVRSSRWSNGADTEVGAVTWGSKATGVDGVVSSSNSLIGSTAGDQVGSNVVVALSNGNYVVASPKWSNGTAAEAGAVTWGNGATGTTGTVSASNSLVGTTAFDAVGGGVVALSNGNYVQHSSSWDDGATVDVGAATWGNGSTGTTGVVSVANSLIGSTADDRVGAGSIVALSNGNYVVSSSSWDDGATAGVGAATWGNGTSGTTGTVSSANSLVGSTAYDSVGGSVLALSNGNYIVGSPNWDDGTVSNAGAVTWGNGTTGTTGTVSSSNSLVGASASDQAGGSVLVALTNGNYLVSTTSWDDGATADVGAVTWGNGATGTSGVISASNSLVGSTEFDGIGGDGSVVALSNGNYLVLSLSWDNGASVDVGAVTWGNGTTGTFGVVSSTNSLVGASAGDQVGSRAIVALSNGNYLVLTPGWDDGATVDVGAVTWGNGAAGTFGAVSSSNSLVGSTADDRVGDGGAVALTNGNYVVSSPGWDDGATADVGAVTWGNGTTGTVGAVSSSNSVVGVTASDGVGGVTPLTNGNYVVVSRFWDDGATVDVGAVTWGNGTTGTFGAVSSSNSLVGSTASDQVGRRGVVALSNGNYVVHTSDWDNGAVSNAGALTWGNGTGGTVGAVSSSNSLVGSTSGDQVGRREVLALADGNYVARTNNWDNGAVGNAGAVTWGDGSTAGTRLTGPISSSNSIVGNVADGSSFFFVRIDEVNDQLVVGRPSEYTVTWLGIGSPVFENELWVSTRDNEALGRPDYAVGSECGDDTNLAWQSSASIALQTAADRIAASGTVYICPGTYPLATTLSVGQEDVTFENASYDMVDLDLTDIDAGVSRFNVAIEALSPTSGGPAGGVQLVSVSEVDAVTFRGISFSDGVSADDGGAISALASEVTLDTCRFAENTAGGNGGAVAARSVNVVAGTGRSDISGIFAASSSNFDGSAEPGHGGAIYASESVNVTNSVFFINRAIADSDGGAIWAPNVAVASSMFILNTTGDLGGGTTSLSTALADATAVGGHAPSAASMSALADAMGIDTQAWAAAADASPDGAGRQGAGGAIASGGALSAITVTDSMFTLNGPGTQLGGVIAARGADSSVDIDYSSFFSSGLSLGGATSDAPERGGVLWVEDGAVSMSASSVYVARAIDGAGIAVDAGTVNLDYTGFVMSEAVGTGSFDGNGSAILVGGSLESAPAGVASSIANSYFTIQSGASVCSFPVGSEPLDGGYNLSTTEIGACPGLLVADADIGAFPFAWTPLPTAGVLNEFSAAVAVGLPDSVAIDAIPATEASCTGTDQWGVARPVGVGCDIGPWEAVDEADIFTSGTFTVPAGITTIDVLLVGGGGAGEAPAVGAGGGGGGGEVAVCTDIEVTPGEELQVTVGAGGVGLPGESSTLQRGTTVLCSAAGGAVGEDGQGGASGGTGVGGEPWTGTGGSTGGGGGGTGDDGLDGIENYGGSGGSGAAPDAGMFSSSMTLFGGGGGGGAFSTTESPAAGSGLDGGGDGAAVGLSGAFDAANGTAGTGGGGGGSADGGTAGSGGSGTAVIRHGVALSGVATTTTTQVSATSIEYGQTISDTATVVAAEPSAPTKARFDAADLGTPTGDVDWYYCYDADTAPTSCDDEAGTFIDTITLDANGEATLSDWDPAVEGDGVGFYLFHAAYQGDGTFLPSADDGTNESFEVTKATASLVYTGSQYLAAGTTTAVLSATLSPSACRTGSVSFSWDSDGDGDYDTLLGTGTIDGSSGAASYLWTLPAGASLLDVLVEYAGDANCTDATVTATIIVAGSGDSSNGGGRYSQNGRVNFGYTVQVKTSRTGVTTVTGQMLWHLNGKTRIKGAITGYSKVTCPAQSPSLSGATCGYIVGTGRLSVWDADTDSWVYTGTSIGFRVWVADGGSATTCVKRRCTTSLKPDYFRMDVPSQTVEGESATLQQLNGGNLIVK